MDRELPAHPITPPVGVTGRRVRIGVLIGDLKGGYEHRIFGCLVQAAKTHGVQLICHASGPLDIRYAALLSPLVLGRLTAMTPVDGYIVLFGALSSYSARADLDAFFANNRHLPIVTLAGPVDGCPTITLDNYGGVRQLTEHLIINCGRRRIVFIRGPVNNVEDEHRFRGYVDALAAAGLDYRPELVLRGDYDARSGVSVMMAFLDQAHAPFDAVIGGNDEMILGTMTVLRRHGFAIPGDVACVGIDDIDLARFADPPLTTLSQSMDRQATQALESVLAMLVGQEVPSYLEIPGVLVVRDSCGYRAGSIAPPPAALSAEQAISLVARRIAPLLVDADDRLPPEDVNAVAHHMVTLFRCDIDSAAGATLATYLHGWKDRGAVPGYTRALLRTLPFLRTHAACLAPAVDEARVSTVVGGCYETLLELNDHAVIANRLAAADLIEEDGRVLMYVTSFAELAVGLSYVLGRLGIRNAYLMLMDDVAATPMRARLILECDEAGCRLLPNHGIAYPFDRLLPEPLELADLQNWIVELLHYHDEVLGVVALQIVSHVGIYYDSLREQLSTTLKTLLLLEQARTYAQRLEEEVNARTVELREALTQQRELLQIVSHDLRNPLTAIWLRSSSLSNNWQTLQTEAVERYLENIAASASHMSSIVTRLLDLDQLESSRLELNLVTVDLNMLAQTAVAGHQLSASAKQIVVVFEPTGGPCYAQADPDVVQQALDNLLSNAIKFSHTQRTVFLRTAVAGQQARIDVTDQGPGFSDTDSEKLFHKYGRLSATPTAGEQSIGLGLYIAKKLVTAMGGDILAHSNGVNQGSTFTIVLPIVSAA